MCVCVIHTHTSWGNKRQSTTLTSVPNSSKPKQPPPLPPPLPPAPFSINPMIGPYPTILDDWGAKNTFKLVVDGQWSRLFMPIFLHSGVIHLLGNLAIQLDQCKTYERQVSHTRATHYDHTAQPPEFPAPLLRSRRERPPSMKTEKKPRGYNYLSA